MASPTPYRARTRGSPFDGDDGVSGLVAMARSHETPSSAGARPLRRNTSAERARVRDVSPPRSVREDHLCRDDQHEHEWRLREGLV